MAKQAKLQVEKGFFSTKDEVLRDIVKSGFWPTTYMSEQSPELPVHWHDGDILGYVMEGSTYILDENADSITLEPGDKLVIPAGALHAEGAVTERVTYIVTLSECVPFFDALRMLDPDSFPTPDLLNFDPSVLGKRAEIITDQA